MQEDVVLTLLQGDSRINKVLDKLENEGFKWYSDETPQEGYESIRGCDVNLYIHVNKRITYGSLNYIDSNFKDITIDEFLGSSNLTFNSIITSTEPLYIEFKDRNKFKRFIMECYMREEDVFSNTDWEFTFINVCEIPEDAIDEFIIYIKPFDNYICIKGKNEYKVSNNCINGDDITYPSISKDTINSIISPIIKNGEVVKNYKEIVDVIAKLKEL